MSKWKYNLPNSKELRQAIEVEAFDEDSVNMHLEDLWNYCDMRKVWVEL